MLQNRSLVNSSQTVVTISFFKYKGLDKVWGLTQMQRAKEPISEIPGILFHKLMGSGGGNGFSLKPDFSVYALLTVWKNINYAKNFHKTSKLFREFKNHSHEWWTLYMIPVKSEGKWGGENPFVPASNTIKDDEPVAIFTRATISPRHLVSFWNSVPGVSDILKEQDGLLFSKGLGEYPIVQQATFSIWESKRAMTNYAYENDIHKDVIGKTRQHGWYNEDLFSEFKIIDSNGSWEGTDPLRGYLNKPKEKSKEMFSIESLLKQSVSEKN